MRKSNKTNTLVIVTDYTRGVYHDKWIGGVLHYTGMGLTGDQDINYMQNRTLNEMANNSIDVHLFEVLDSGVYTYCGRIEMVGKPYKDRQPDADGRDRSVWMFLVRPVPENNVKKPKPFAFKDMDDFRANGKNAEASWAATRKTSSRKSGSGSKSSGLVGKKIRHKAYGIGTISKYDGTIITVKFGKKVKTLNYELCTGKGIIEFV